MPLNRLDDSGVPLPIPDVQQTTFSHDALGRYICNTWEEATANPNFDAVVIGSGMYGGYCAAKLFRAGETLGLRTLVLEAGSFLVSEHTQNLTNFGLFAASPIFGNQDTGLPRNVVWGLPWRGNQAFPGLAYCVGGKSVFWGGWCPRLTPADLTSWPASVSTYLDDTYGTVEEEIGVVPTADYISGPLCTALKSSVMGALGTVPNLDGVAEAPLAVQGEPPAPGLFSFDKYSSAPILTAAIRDAAGAPDSSRRLFLVPRAQVARLHTNGGVVTAIEVFVNGQQRFLNISPTCAVVLAASGIESTRLALESFPTPLMGRNLMAHLRTDFTVRIKRSALLANPPGPIELAALIVRGSTARGRFHQQVTAGADMGNSDRFLFNMIPDADLIDQLAASQDPNFIAITLRGIAEMTGFRGAGTPGDRSWMDLSPFERDQHNNRRAYVNIATTPDERTLWDEMDAAALDLALAIAGDPADIEYGYDGGWQKTPPSVEKRRESQFRRGLGSTYHESGTLWMGTNPADSVTNEDGRFHHIANAYCVDQALFPTVGSANPVLTGLTLTRRVTAAIVRSRTPVSQNGFTPIPTDSLSGWQMAGNGRFRSVDLDVLESEGGIGLLWWTREQFADFVLRLDWRAFNADDNSGVFFRFPTLGTGDPANDWKPAVTRGYEVQIDDRGFNAANNSTGSALHQTGAIYELAAASRLVSRPLGQWNTFEIEARGEQLKVTLNGEQVSDHRADGARSAAGHIGLQNHHPGSRVQFRNLQIKKL